MRLILPFLLVSIVFLCSCEKNCQHKDKEIKSIMKTWYKKKIIFPENFEVIAYNNMMDENNLKNKIPVLKKYTIIHFFTADCDKCVNELKLITSYIKSNKIQEDLDYIFIASAPTKKYVIDAIEETKFPYPIYLEKDYYSFKKINNFSTDNELYNTMIVNKNQEVILFGGYYSNKKAQRLFREIVKCEL